MQILASKVIKITKGKFGNSGIEENVLSTLGKHQIRTCTKRNINSFQKDDVEERKECPRKKRFLISLREA